MLPEFLFTVGNSMQEISRDDFSLLSGATTSCEKDICPTVQSVNNSTGLSGTIGKPATADIVQNFDGQTLQDIKLEDTSSADLFPTHPTTWQQHPMNSHELAHHRLQHHHQQEHQQHHQQHHHQHHQQHHPHQQHLPHPHHTHHNRLSIGTSKLLLQGSDDPLICHGANSVINDDDHPVEFTTLIAAVANGKQQLQHHTALPIQLKPATVPATATQKRPQNGCSLLTKQQLKVKAGLMSAQNQIQSQAVVVAPPPKTRTPKPKRKGVLKLRFHHQALPPEYLSHYEATQGQLAAKASAKDGAPAREAHAFKISHTAKLPPPKSAHENVRSWLQKIAEIQRSAQKQQAQQQQGLQQQHQQQQQQQQQLQLMVPDQPNRSVQTRTPHDATSNQQTHNAEAPSPASVTYDRMAIRSPKPPPPLLSSPRLEHSAKEPSAKTLHLPSPAKRVINYADLPYMGEITLDNSKPRRGRKPKKADICHLIYKNYGTIFPGTPKNVFDGHDSINAAIKLKSDLHGLLEEPLNLCLRDQSVDLYSVSSDDDDDAQASDSISNGPTPVATPSDSATDTLLAANMKVSMPTLDKKEHLRERQSQSKATSDIDQAPTSTSPLLNMGSNNATTNLLLHPVSMYYQKLLESGTLIQQNGHAFGMPIGTIEKDNQLALKIPIPSGLFLTPKMEKTSTTVAHNNPALDYPEPMSTPSSIKSENSNATTATTASSLAGQQLPPQKRKRSAIFIPPMPAENTTNPATEVSICKFKFTGGAKPTLQEKKMLSVDSDGNYRYYSGTGDKSMRGYEFFPRESLQQSGLIPGMHCAGAFLNATGEKISIDIPPPSAGLSNELLQIPDSPTAALLLPPVAGQTVSSTQDPLSPYSLSPNMQSTKIAGNAARPYSTDAHVLPADGCLQRSAERKKKSRRSSQREKLEKTFKEKGFLIQTQQLESAEGATYCKFRQLKKFTRYLFRNWKEYLPDDLQQANAVAAAAAAAAALSKQQNDGSHDMSPAGQQATIESILATHGFGSDPCLMRDSQVNAATATAATNAIDHTT